MSIAILSTGTELLKGSILNTNAGFLCRRLAAAGLRPVLELTAGDHPAEIAAALGDALRAADTVIITGGLGPTRDDLTLDAVSRFFGLELEIDPALAEKVEAFWSRRHEGRRAPKTVLRQARVPRGAAILPNPNGSASGIRIDAGYGGRQRTLFLLPGPPAELEPMVEHSVIPAVVTLEAGAAHEYTQGFLAAGLGEYAVQLQLEKLLHARPVELAYCARPEGTRVYLSGSDPAEVDAAVSDARSALGTAALPAGKLDLVETIAGLLEERNLTLVTAESCTGGRIAGMLTDHAGISSVFKGGAVVYSNELKHALLGVPEELLARHGAVSAECAEAMVRGATDRLEADCAVAVTGIAGPGGGTPEKPVGLVYIAAKVRDQLRVGEFHFSGDRRRVRECTAARALLLLLGLLRGDASQSFLPPPQNSLRPEAR